MEMEALVKQITDAICREIGTVAPAPTPPTRADEVLLPEPSLSNLAALATLVADSPATARVIEALARGERVRVSLPSWWAGRRAGLPFLLQRKVEEYIKAAESYGVVFGECLAPVPDTARRDEQARGEGCRGECTGCGHCAGRNEDMVKAIVGSGAGRVGAAPGVSVKNADLARLIDHTLLKPDATPEEIAKLCQEAREYGFASVCVNPGNVAQSAALLAGSPVKVCTVVGFPLGATTPTVKALETRDAVANGAEEIDMVMSVGALKAGHYDQVFRDIEGVVEAAGGRVVKVILETALLNNEQKVKACLLAKRAGADFVKTSTGFGPGGATVEDIQLMRETVGPDLGVKASGGIRDRATAEKMVSAGATRIGASASVAIVKAQPPSEKGY